MIKIELTPQQFNQLYELLVIGMKAGNVNNMKVGLPLVDILEAAAATSQAKPE
jgi:hypothetical protein